MILGKKVFCVLAALIGCVLYLLSSVSNKELRNGLSVSTENYKVSKELSVKKILYWNVYFGIKDFGFGSGRTPFVHNNCTIDNCYATKRREDGPRLEDFDAIIFHMWDMKANDKELMELSKTRRLHQRYVFFLLEAPGIYHTNLKTFHNFFNWTMTYRRDSDFHRPYGIFTPMNFTPPYVRNWKTLPDPGNGRYNVTVSPAALKKRRLVAWFVSKCKTPSKRELYADELRKHINVDVYGNCGTLKCPGRMSNECYKMLDRKYKFYMSFENSVCSDYVTEKVFAVMQYRVVPIVYGGADYKRILPPGSFIDTSDFSSPKDLAEYLKKLDANTDEYNKYFRWKESYQVIRAPMFLAMCKLCAMLNDPSQPPKSYSSIYEWYSGTGVCRDTSVHLKKIGL